MGSGPSPYGSACLAAKGGEGALVALSPLRRFGAREGRGFRRMHADQGCSRIRLVKRTMSEDAVVIGRASYTSPSRAPTTRQRLPRVSSSPTASGQGLWESPPRPELDQS